MGVDRKYGKITTERIEIPDDEPLFIIRGQDMAAVASIRCYADLARRAGAEEDHVVLARASADTIDEWQNANPDRVKIPDTESAEATVDSAVLEAVKQKTGEEIEPDRVVEEHEGWHFGESVRVLEDDEENGIFAGDKGILVIEIVGDKEYNSERIHVGILIDGQSSVLEIAVDNIEGA